MDCFGPLWQGNADARDAMDALSACLRQRHGDSVETILFYGSCLRSGDLYDGLVDLYVIVSGYRAANMHALEATAAFLLPPNVYYLQTDVGQRTVRCKYAVLSADTLQRAVSTRWFQSYVWGRFCQPVAIAYCRSDVSLATVRADLRQACLSLLQRALPSAATQGSILQLWETGIGLSYATELRAERAGRSAMLAEDGAAHYLAATRALRAALGDRIVLEGDTYRSNVNPRQRRFSAAAWMLRRVQGKCLSILRLLKALFTFEGGLDYIAWKLTRHSGRTVVIPDRVRRYPLLFVWPFMLQLYRQGIFK